MLNFTFTKYEHLKLSWFYINVPGTKILTYPSVANFKIVFPLIIQTEWPYFRQANTSNASYICVFNIHIKSLCLLSGKRVIKSFQNR